MRLTNQFSVMGRKYDLSFGQANTWKRKLKNDKYELIENAIDKLGQLEDIEDELGIDLITLFKAVSNGVYMSTKHFGIIYCKCPKIIHYKSGWKILVYGATLSLTTYGINWALTKEELK